jgi:hypothetical protein
MSKEALEVLEGMTAASQEVVDCWSQGNLAGAVNSLECWIEPARNVLATRKQETDELAAALELCVDCLSELSRLDDGTPSVSALQMARDALAKAGR